MELFFGLCESVSGYLHGQK